MGRGEYPPMPGMTSLVIRLCNFQLYSANQVASAVELEFPQLTTFVDRVEGTNDFTIEFTTEYPIEPVDLIQLAEFIADALVQFAP